jgi:hypothetical protein
MKIVRGINTALKDEIQGINSSAYLASFVGSQSRSGI